MKYAICEQNYKTFTAKIARLNAKLARINVPAITVSVTGIRDEPHSTKPNVLARLIDVEVTAVQPSVNGWTFVATIVHTADGNIIRAVPGYTVPVEFRDRPTWCDHCKTNRTRRDTYVVQHEDGRTMQVGSSCLAEFVGCAPGSLVKAAEHVLNAYDVCAAAQDSTWLSGGANAYRIDLDTFLSNVAAVVLGTGKYVTRKVANESGCASTSDIAYWQMNSATVQYPVTEDATKLAANARSWVIGKYSVALPDGENMGDDDFKADLLDSLFSTNMNLSEFEHNLLACARSEAIEPRLCGISAYIVEAFRRSQPRAEAAQLNSAGLTRIFSMFESAAKSKLKHPSIRLSDDAGNCIQLSLAGSLSKNAGCIYVKGERGSDAYYGKITPEGKFYPVATCPKTVEPHLLAFSADPETMAAKYGKLTGCCSFCGRKLSDERSVTVGYGSTCAAKFDLTWGVKASAAVKVADFVPVEAAVTA